MASSTDSTPATPDPAGTEPGNDTPENTTPENTTPENTTAAPTEPAPTEPGGSMAFRTIWISDVHLGTRGCKADFLLDFLRHTESETLYLVGDIIDGWRLRKAWFWPQAHNDVVQKLLRKARKGTKVVYLPGNHDEFARPYSDSTFGEIEVHEELVHTLKDGRRLLVLHGDAFDGVVRYAKWVAHLGDTAYTIALSTNHWLNVIRRRLGYPYWSLSAFLKKRVKNAVQFMNRFETTMADEARRRHLDGVVCGHIHQAALKDCDGILYANDGDWVETCSALVEHHDGRLEILYWPEISKLDFFTAYAPAKAGKETEDQCAYSSSRTPGFLKSMASYARLIRSGQS